MDDTRGIIEPSHWMENWSPMGRSSFQACQIKFTFFPKVFFGCKQAFHVYHNQRKTNWKVAAAWINFSPNGMRCYHFRIECLLSQGSERSRCSSWLKPTRANSIPQEEFKVIANQNRSLLLFSLQVQPRLLWRANLRASVCSFVGWHSVDPQAQRQNGNNCAWLQNASVAETYYL